MTALRSRPLTAWLFLSLLLALCLPACSDSTDLAGTACKEDVDCGTPAEAFLCDEETGACFCRTDTACKPTEFCNSVGFCQNRAGCEVNEDCLDPNLFCDTSSGSCLALGRCTNDLHCNLGEVCDTARTTCVPGCRSHGDCPGTSCRCDTAGCECPGTTPEERAACQVGICDAQFCANDTFCKYGEKCGVVPNSGTPLAQCFSDFDADRRPYCASCTGGTVGLEYCAGGANYCLVDTVNVGNYYCGVDCTEDSSSCPRGFGCSDVIRVYTRCSDTEPCQPNPSLPCATDAQCPFGGKCQRANPSDAMGACAPPCMREAEENIGFCGCQTDSDCGETDVCGTSNECSVSRRPCIQDSDCRAHHCVAYQGAGGCFIGRNCAPENGLQCVDIQ